MQHRKKKHQAISKVKQFLFSSGQALRAVKHKNGFLEPSYKNSQYIKRKKRSN
jgi:hypothetical protein